VHEDDGIEREDSLFEYVDEREYAKIVQERQEAGFVLDDGEDRLSGFIDLVLKFAHW